MLIGKKKFTTGTHIMAIINITPDSFFAESRINGIDKILWKVEECIKEGAEIIDIGGQSTRPNFQKISWQEELERILKPIIEIKKIFDVPISVDTFYSQVAEEVLKENVEMINDVFCDDTMMANVVAKYNAAICLTHNSRETEKKNSISDIISYLDDKIKEFLQAGVDKEKICLDGGIGFGKTIEENWTLMDNYEKLSVLGLPLLLGTSMKSFLGGNVEDRLEKTLETTKKAIGKNILFVRVHNVKANMEIIKNTVC